MSGIDVSGVKATLDLDNSGFKRALQEAKQEMKIVTDESKKFNEQFKDISKSLRDLGMDTQGIQKVRAELLATNPQILDKQIQSLVKKMYDLGASSDQVRHLKEQITEGTSIVKQLNEQLTTNSASGLDQSAISAKNLSNEINSLGSVYNTFTGVVATSLSKAISLSSEFEQAMANLKSVSQITGDQFELLRKQALDFGGTTQFTASQVVDAQTMLSEAGFKTNEVMAAMPGILSLASASGTDLATSATVTSSALHGFGLAAEDSAKVADVLAKSAIDTHTNITDLGSALQYVAPVAGVMGLSMEEAVASIGELAQAGLTGQMAGEQLQTILLALTSPSQDAAMYMEQLGISITDSSGKIKPFSEIIGQLQNAFQNLTQAQQADVAASLVGEEAKTSFISLIREGREGLEGYTQSLQNAGGTAQEVAEVQMDTLNGSILQLKTALESAGIVVGDNFASALRSLVDWLTQLVLGFTNLNPSIQAAIVAFPVITAGILGLAAAVGALTIAFQALEVSFPILGAISLALGLVGAGVAALVVSHNEAEEATRKFEEAQKSLNDVLNQSGLERSVEEVKELQETNEALIEILEKRAVIQERMDQIKAKTEAGEFIANPSEMLDLAMVMGDLEEQMEGLGITAEDAAGKQKEINDAINDSIPALREMQQEELSGIATKVQHIDQMNELKRQYDDLTGKEHLSVEQKQMLGNVVKSLVKEYPSLTASLDEENRWHITNEDSLRSLIGAESDSIQATTSAAKQRLESWRKETQAKLELAQKQLKALSAISENAKADPMTKALKGTEMGVLLENTVGKQLGKQLEQDTREKQNKINEYREEINKIDQDLQSITAGAFDKFSNVNYGDGIDLSKPKKEKGVKTKIESKGKTAAEQAKELREKAYNADMASARYMADMYDWSADQQVNAYNNIATKHKQHLKESIEDERSMNLLIKRLYEDSTKSRYEISSSWVTAEEKRMQKSGKSEIEISQMKIDAWSRVRNRYSENSEYYKEADDKLFEARKVLISETEKAMKELYSTNTDFLKQEERRMEETGASETEIARMKYALWTRIRDSYSKDSEYYKLADDQVYQAKKDLISKIQKDNADARKKEKANNETAKKEELAAIAERKKAYTDDIDERIAAIDRLIKAEDRLNSQQDYESQLTEKRARQELLADAVSPEGRKEYADLTKEIERMELEHSRDIRKQNLEDQKQALQDEKSEREKAFDKEKDDTEKHYAAIIENLDNYQDDVKLMEAGIQDYRVEITQIANAQILSDLDVFVSSYNSKLASITKASGPTQQANDLQEYNDNKDAWVKAKAAGNTEEMKRLNERNSAIRKQYGIVEDNGKLENLPSMVVSKQDSSSGSSPLQAIAHSVEAIFKPQQLDNLFRLLEVPPSLTISNHKEQPKEIPVQQVHIDMSVGAVEVNDSADAELLYSSRERTARRLAAAGGGTK